MREGLKGTDVVMMLRLQTERMSGAFLPSAREFYHLYGLDRAKLAHAKPRRARDASGTDEPRASRSIRALPTIPNVSLIQSQVEMGVAVRMAVLDALARNLPLNRN